MRAAGGEYALPMGDLRPEEEIIVDRPAAGENGDRVDGATRLVLICVSMLQGSGSESGQQKCD